MMNTTSTAAAAATRRRPLTDHSQYWSEAIHEATACLRDHQHQQSYQYYPSNGGYYNSNNNNRGGGGFYGTTYGGEYELDHLDHDADDVDGNTTKVFDSCLAYLTILEQALQIITRRKDRSKRWNRLYLKKYWMDYPPDTLPPVTWEQHCQGGEGGGGGGGGSALPPPIRHQVSSSSVRPPPGFTSTSHSNRNSRHHPTSRFDTRNSFAVLESDDDDDDDDDEDDEDDDENNVETEQQHLEAETASITTLLDRRRLLLRIETCQSEVYARKATALRVTKQWKRGADQYTKSLDTIRHALHLADAEISKWITITYSSLMTSNNHNNNDNTRQDSSSSSSWWNQELKLQQLQSDADIVQVAIASLVKERDVFFHKAQQQEANLLRYLQPQWRSRDEVKQRMGTERWTNNPNPKKDYAERRIQAEQELNDIREALQELETTAEQEETTEQEVAALQAKVAITTNASMVTRQQQQQGDEVLSRQRRYNGTRPNLDLYARRVSWDDYPDPTEFGWTFTGSWNTSEFFERLCSNNNEGDDGDDDGDEQVLVKLDWYFTTGTLKTSLYHPTQEKHTQLFLSSTTMDPQQYRAILTNPRTHTGNRYHTRGGRGGRGHGGRAGGRDRRRSGGGGRGRGRGRGGRGGRGRGEGGRGGRGGRSRRQSTSNPRTTTLSDSI